MFRHARRCLTAVGGGTDGRGAWSRSLWSRRHDHAPFYITPTLATCALRPQARAARPYPSRGPPPRSSLLGGPPPLLVVPARYARARGRGHGQGRVVAGDGAGGRLLNVALRQRRPPPFSLGWRRSSSLRRRRGSRAARFNQNVLNKRERA